MLARERDTVVHTLVYFSWKQKKIVGMVIIISPTVMGQTQCRNGYICISFRTHFAPCHQTGRWNPLPFWKWLYSCRCHQVDEGINCEIVRSVLMERANCPYLAAQTATEVRCYVPHTPIRPQRFYKIQIVFVCADTCRWKHFREQKHFKKSLKRIQGQQGSSVEKKLSLLWRYCFKHVPS